LIGAELLLHAGQVRLARQRPEELFCALQRELDSQTAGELEHDHLLPCAEDDLALSSGNGPGSVRAVHHDVSDVEFHAWALNRPRW
jgi:hypothetical protein